jgi:hypothetical protein
VATISASLSVESAARSGFQQLRVQEARRSADRAEQVARSLQSAAQVAQREADQANENARSLSVRSGQARVDAGRARQGVDFLDSVGRMEAQLVNTVGQVAERVTEPAAVQVRAVEASSPSAVVNTQGQLTGTLVSTQA